MSDIRSTMTSWSPGPLTVTRTIHQEPIAAFAALMNQAPLAPTSELVPPLWHWFHFTPTEPRSELGDDGHPTAGHFLPPFENRRRMMAGGQFRMLRPMTTGATYERHSELTSAVAKTGRSGEILLVKVRHRFVLGDETIAIEDEDVVYRQQAQGEPRKIVSNVAEPHPAGSDLAAVTLPTDPVTLFRFSALTYNAHRIHFDHPYATTVEGYPNTVVHGPLLALLLLELPRRLQPSRRVARFSYRLQKPLFCGALVEARVLRNDGNRWEVAAGLPGDPSAAVGVVEFG